MAEAWGELLSLSDYSPNIALAKRVVKIGRGKGCDVRLKCDVVSTNHCFLTRDVAGAVTITDTSRNGTYIDGKELRNSTMPLENGAEVGVSIHEASVIKFIFRLGKPMTPRADGSGGTGVGVGVSVIASGGPRTLESLYTVGPKLGSGAFATVFEGTHKVTKAKVAIKRIDKRRAQMMAASRSSVEDVLQAEVDILKRLRHQNIVGLKDSFDTDRYFYIVLEYASAGELFDKIIEKSKFTEDQAQGLFHQIMNGINYLHSQDVAHRDLKPENILLHRVSDARVGRYVVKITDFGMSRVVPPSNLMSTFAGTPQYLAPEVLSSSTTGQGYGRQVDMWSLGVILYILLSGMQPFSDTPAMPLLDQVKAGRVQFPDHIWGSISDDAKDLVKRLLTVDPEKRITGDGVMKHTWMTSRMQQTTPKASSGRASASASAAKPSEGSDGARAGSLEHHGSGSGAKSPVTPALGTSDTVLATPSQAVEFREGSAAGAGGAPPEEGEEEDDDEDEEDDKEELALELVTHAPSRAKRPVGEGSPSRKKTRKAAKTKSGDVARDARLEAMDSFARSRVGLGTCPSLIDYPDGEVTLRNKYLGRARCVFFDIDDCPDWDDEGRGTGGRFLGTVRWKLETDDGGVLTVELVSTSVYRKYDGRDPIITAKADVDGEVVLDRSWCSNSTLISAAAGLSPVALGDLVGHLWLASAEISTDGTSAAETEAKYLADMELRGSSTVNWDPYEPLVNPFVSGWDNMRWQLN